MRIDDVNEIAAENIKQNELKETVEKAANELINEEFVSNDATIKFAIEVGFKEGADWQQKKILQFLYSEITERRDYSASKMCEKVIEFINK